MIVKRLNAPKSYRIPRKVKRFVLSTMPGPHSRNDSVPLGVVLRDYLGVAETMREVKMALATGKIKVDGRVIKEKKFPVGLMDVLSVADSHYRMLVGKHGLFLKEIPKAESMKKPAKIKRKTAIPGGKIQYTLHDGRNIIAENKYRNGDTLLISVPEQKVIDHFEFKEGYIGYVTAGRKAGAIGSIKQIKITKSFRPNRVIIESPDGDVETIADYIFTIGKNKPCIELGESNE